MKRRGPRIGEILFKWACLAAVLLPLFVLVGLIADTVIDAWPRLSLGFLTGYPSRKAEEAGLLPALMGSVWLVGLTAAIALPIGIGAAVYLEEYAEQGRLASIIEINIANLAGVPSVIYGLLGLGVFVRTLGMGRSVLAAACTLSLLVLPIVIISTREALRTVPNTLREAAYGLGASRWQTVRSVVVPMALPGVLTGAILSISRAIGETAPLIVVGAVAYIRSVPTGPTSEFTALPIQIFNWVSRPQEEFVVNAAAGIVVLLLTMLTINGFAIALRNRLQRRLR
ncbi:MAG: phosphate transport system permease protein [Myxococcota bacterium]|jgi:phosphate transport system permease protein